MRRGRSRRRIQSCPGQFQPRANPEAVEKRQKKFSIESPLRHRNCRDCEDEIVRTFVRQKSAGRCRESAERKQPPPVWRVNVAGEKKDRAKARCRQQEWQFRRANNSR